MKKTLTIGPFPIIFSNENRELNIPLHHHYAEVRLAYSFSGNAGFPVLALTIDKVREQLDKLVKEPLLNKRNEDLLEILYQEFKDWESDEMKKYRGEWQFNSVELAVLGTRDKLGHADGIATYRLEV